MHMCMYYNNKLTEWKMQIKHFQNKCVSNQDFATYYNNTLLENATNTGKPYSRNIIINICSHSWSKFVKFCIKTKDIDNVACVRLAIRNEKTCLICASRFHVSARAAVYVTLIST